MRTIFAFERKILAIIHAAIIINVIAGGRLINQ